jgi:hypothetical protein
MELLDRRAGRTQIEKVLVHARRETGLLPVSALVFVGDALEETTDKLFPEAHELGRLKGPAFMFQEGQRPRSSMPSAKSLALPAAGRGQAAE